MGKKSKANRKKAPVATAATEATVAVAASAAATAGVAASAAGWGVSEFPKSTFFVKGKSFRKKGNVSKANKIILQGIENGCFLCLNDFTMKFLYDGASSSIENMKTDTELINNNTNLHLVLPLFLEGAIRGSYDASNTICGVYNEASHETDDVHRYGNSLPAAPLILYWKKIWLKNFDRGEDRTKAKKENEEVKEWHGTWCSVCEKEDSETVTLMKCDGCKFYYYCSKECQKKMWREGQHAGVCLHLGLLKKYHKPFAKKIRTDLMRGIAPTNISELVELRHRLGLSRPQADYQELLDGAQSRLDPTQLMLPRKDGTVQIGSFPRPI